MPQSLTTLQSLALGPVLTVSGVSAVLVNTVGYPGPTTAANPAGGETITITGSGFANGIEVFVDSTLCNTTYVSATSLTFVSPANSTGSYNILVYNADGTGATKPAGITYSPIPVYVTAAGALSAGTLNLAYSTSVSATGDGTITYSVTSGSLPTGLNFNSSTGAITGTPTVEATSNFAITASDSQNQTVSRSFSITVVDTINSVEYLVVAGGGSGGGYSVGSGGAGAGGYRSSIAGEYSGRGAAAESALTGITAGVTYTVTIGAGGASVQGEEVSGFKGANSSISGSGITTITSLGGGAGGPNSSGVSPRRYDTEGIGNGGSGGGAAEPMGNPVVQGLGTAGQGYDCGTNNSAGPGSGGGGAGGQGGAAATEGFGGIGAKSNATTSFAGTASVSSSNNTLTVTAVSAGIIDVGTQVTGNGIPANSYIIARGTGTGNTGTYYMNINGTVTNSGVAITSTGRYYAGGGAGCTRGFGGAGGGGANPGQTNAIANCALNGATNTGGGGGGAGPSGAGGSGTVIIRYADSFPAAVSTTGSPTITTSGGYRVYTFTGSGSIRFNN